MHACMGDDTMKSEFPTQSQRVAVCLSTFRRAKKKHGKAEWDEVKAEIDEKGIVLTEEEAKLILAGNPREQIEDGKPTPFAGRRVGQFTPLRDKDGNPVLGFTTKVVPS